MESSGAGGFNMCGYGQPRGAAAAETARWWPGRRHRRRVAVDPAAADRKPRRPLDAPMVTALVGRRGLCPFTAPPFFDSPVVRGIRSHFTTQVAKKKVRPAGQGKKNLYSFLEPASVGFRSDRIEERDFRLCVPSGPDAARITRVTE